VNDQRGQAQCARGQWTEILFFAIFRAFAMDTTLLRLIFIQNVKKGKNQPHPIPEGVLKPMGKQLLRSPVWWNLMNTNLIYCHL
jgi:hypothetical protein